MPYDYEIFTMKAQCSQKKAAAEMLLQSGTAKANAKCTML